MGNSVWNIPWLYGRYYYYCFIIYHSLKSTSNSLCAQSQFLSHIRQRLECIISKRLNYSPIGIGEFKPYWGHYSIIEFLSSLQLVSPRRSASLRLSSLGS